MIILLSPDYHCYLNYANELLHYFVKTFETIYGRQHISHNVHVILHLTEDYQHFGPLDNCSAFPFENFMKELKSKVRKHEKPLEQLVNRYTEIYKLPITPIILKELPILAIKHKNGLTIDNIIGLQFKQTILYFYYILTNNREVVQCLNFIKTDNGKINLIGKAFMTKNPLYKKPIDSTIFDIYIIHTINDKLQCWNNL